jgi:hypothetical protein
MLWNDYNIDQAGDNFKVVGEWEGEVMGKQRDGTDKGYHLYKPGDVFVVNNSGWLCKVEDVAALMIKYEASKVKDEV